MNTKMFYIFTRTPLHVGAGSSVGAIDMPIQRERHTQIPIIPGSSLKGVLRDLFAGDSEQERLFGPPCESKDDHFAGSLLIGEARVLCFPVRSAKGSFAWLTCPLALGRYARERGVPLPFSVSSVFPCSEEDCLAGNDVVLDRSVAGGQHGKAVVLEEYSFTVKGESPEDVTHLLDGILPGDELWKTMQKRLVIVADGIFSHFCATACEVQQRIQINDATGVAKDGALFNQENVPSETLFYAVVAERVRADAAGERKDGTPDDGKRKDGITELDAKLKSVNNILQIGGDETIGLGFCSVILEGGAA